MRASASFDRDGCFAHEKQQCDSSFSGAYRADSKRPGTGSEHGLL
jgi:hypothetical protein